MKKIKYSLIENKTARKATFNKRKKGFMKKLNELVTLCDVKACGVIYSPYTPNPVVWPSQQGVEEVVSEFTKLSLHDQTNNMVDQETYLCKKIAKVKAQSQKLCNENQNIEIGDIMFGCLNGKIDMHKLGEKDCHDLESFIDEYINKLHCRAKTLMEKGESSSSLPLVAADQVPKRIHDFDMNVNWNQNMVLDLNQVPNVEENGVIPSMEGGHHQPEAACLAATIADACAPNITKNLES